MPYSMIRAFRVPQPGMFNVEQKSGAGLCYAFLAVPLHMASSLGNGRRQVGALVLGSEWVRLYWVALVAIYVTLAWPAERPRFGFDDVIAKAEKLAQEPYHAPSPVPRFLEELDYDTCQGIRFRPGNNLWRAQGSRFQVMMVPPGCSYTHAVKINVIGETGVETIPFRKDDFTFTNKNIADRMPPDLGFAGFKLTYPLQGPNTQDQFLVFAGASYFRGVGKNNVFGLSGRGIAVNTGLAEGEQFPSFIEYWLARPGPDATTMTIYALLNGESLTGAYQFSVTPGVETNLKVRSVLFLRKGMTLLGLAPLTSMFFYGENTPRPAGEWRPQVHDSDGLLIHNGSTREWLWRPLINPEQLQEESFDTENLLGFGLLQRETSFREYQDTEARYDQRPSAWITPDGPWGGGKVVLVQIPSAKETDDNIVAFWSPKAPTPAGGRLTHDFSLVFGGNELPGETLARAVNTFVGDGSLTGAGGRKGSYRIIIDFKGESLAALPATASVQGVITPQEDGRVIEHHVEYVRPAQSWRLSLLAVPAEGKPLSLRAHLQYRDQTISETWTYRLPWVNRMHPGGQAGLPGSRDSAWPSQDTAVASSRGFCR